MAGAFDNVVFDLDGTLVDSAPGIERCLREAIAEVAPSVDPVFSADLIGPPVRNMIEALLPGASGVLVDTGVAAFRRCYDEYGHKDTVPYSGAQEMLVTLRSTGRRLFIVTNKPLVPTKRILDELGWTVLFDRVVCRDSTDPAYGSKSAALGALMASESLDPGATVFVGDTHDDAMAARAHSLPFTFARYGYGEPAVAQSAQASIAEPMELVIGLRGGDA